MLLWIDNEIAPPDNKWIWARSIDEAYSTIRNNKREIKLVHINLNLKNKNKFIEWIKQEWNIKYCSLCARIEKEGE